MAVGSHLCPVMANVFMHHLEEKLTRDGLMPHLYVDDTLARMPNLDAFAVFPTTLNGLPPSLTFTMEIPFIGIEIIINGTKLETQVYSKPTNTGLLLHYRPFIRDNDTLCLCFITYNRGFQCRSLFTLEGSMGSLGVKNAFEYP